MKYITTGFTFSFLNNEYINNANISCTKITRDAAILELINSQFVSLIPDEVTAKLVSLHMDMDISYNRAPVSMNKDDKIILVRYSGPVLTEPPTELPENQSFEYYLVNLN